MSLQFTPFASRQPAIRPPSIELGLNGTGLSITSNPVDIIVPGTTSDFAWFSAPGQSQYFASIELLTGTPGSTVRLPYVPNSMLMDQLGNNLYFGSARELMIYSTGTNSLTKQDPTAPGVVLAVSPNDNQLLINDQVGILLSLQRLRRLIVYLRRYGQSPLLGRPTRKLSTLPTTQI